MPIEYRTGDLFAQDDVHAIAHGANCQGIAGAGVAGQIRRRFPNVTGDYVQACIDGEFAAGSSLFTTRPNEMNVFWLATQIQRGANAKLVFIALSVVEMLNQAADLGITSIAIPRIGCGIGGLEWKNVKYVLEEIAAETDITLIVVSMPGDED